MDLRPPAPTPEPVSRRVGFTIALDTSAPRMLSVTVVLVDDIGEGFTPDALVPVIRDWLALDSGLSTLRPIAARLHDATAALSAALAGVSGAGPFPIRKRAFTMAVTDDLATLTTEMNDATSVMDGATAYITTVPDLIAAAVAEAVANGATAEQLAPVTALGTTLEAKAAALTAALTKNITPAA